MKHLFLTSTIETIGICASIRSKLGGNHKLKTAFITTPTEPPDEALDLSWLENERVMLSRSGFDTFDYTITGKSLVQIQSDLSKIDVLHIPGGNEFYLKEKSNESDFGDFVKLYVLKGGTYIGSSCGSIIVGTDMTPLLKLSDHDSLKAPLDTKGFGIVDFTILPHWGSEEFRSRWLNDDSFNYMYQESQKLIALNNYEYVEVLGDKFRIIDVRREK